MNPVLHASKRTRHGFLTAGRARSGGHLNQPRRGTATAEIAFCLPVLLTFTFATVDLCSIFFLKETVAIAAYEGARRGINRGGTNEAAAARVREILDERGVEYGGNVMQMENSTFSTADTLEHVTVVVTVPAAGNLYAPAGLYDGLQISHRITMRKEFANQE
ncbi:pilus assembly protein [Rhodopirellula sp. JC740]|uniref:Pilus assembly protein n=1 Tax=Rhodopirellula halodulae TaxID=2894198 RepID=A0ABS8NM38_9BACT|nr:MULTISPECIES: TadE family protein [unclassified Rhodopirellula]MCC9644439.1 pilus assembly protein [Rhodopirellula sp. JC740]MCC9654892.1 pilus assembly protein [Rhodopirellula sp. JC737]